MEEVAGRIVSKFDEWFHDPATGESSLVLGRLFKTHAYDDLPEELREVARRGVSDGNLKPDMKCLTLLGTTGVRPRWKSRALSENHRVIPLPSVEALTRFPMIMQLVRQFGLEAGECWRIGRPCWWTGTSGPSMSSTCRRRSTAPTSRRRTTSSSPFGVRSVLGFGGMLPGRDLFAVILFSRLSIPRSTAEFFRPLALCLKIALLPFVNRPIFAGMPEATDGGAPSATALAETQASQIAALEQLLEVAEPTILKQSIQLEQALAEPATSWNRRPTPSSSPTATGRIVRLNQQAERMFGYPATALVGQPVEVLVPERLAPEHKLRREDFVAHP